MTAELGDFADKLDKAGYKKAAKATRELANNLREQGLLPPSSERDKVVFSSSRFEKKYPSIRADYDNYKPGDKDTKEFGPYTPSFASLAREVFGGNATDETRLFGLVNDPDIKQQFDKGQRRILNGTLNMISRGGIRTVGDLRQAQPRRLDQLTGINDYGKVFAQKIFERIEPGE